MDREDVESGRRFPRSADLLQPVEIREDQASEDHVEIAAAALALWLACLGIYGVMSRAVLSRTREIGIRAALGAERGSLRRMVVAEAMGPVMVGLAIGIVALVAGQKTLASWIYGVTPEPGALVLTSIVLLAVGLAASAIPAWRASRIDPMEALRVD